MGLCCPLYKDTYKDSSSDTEPAFLSGQAPAVSFNANVGGRLHQVDVFVVPVGNLTYYHIQVCDGPVSGDGSFDLLKVRAYCTA